MRHDDQPDINERAVNRRTQDALTEMHRTRQEFLRAFQAGMLNERLTLRFQARIVDVIEELQPYQNKTDQWDTATEMEGKGLGDLIDLLEPRETTKRTAKGFGREKIETTKEPQTLRPDRLRKISENLDNIARDIGFGPGPKTDPGDTDGGII